MTAGAQKFLIAPTDLVRRDTSFHGKICFFDSR
jgi:hypothetical protein